MLNQQTMIGIAVYVPMVTRKSAPYCRLVLSWTEKRMPNPVRLIHMQNIREPKSMAEVIRESSDQHAEPKCRSPRWHGMKLGPDGTVSIS